MVGMKNIIDTWNMIEKYNIEGAVEIDSTKVEIPAREYERLLGLVVNKKYIQNLRRR